jgi:hypothetical protein
VSVLCSAGNSTDTISQERRILEEVENANKKLDDLRHAVSEKLSLCSVAKARNAASAPDAQWEGHGPPKTVEDNKASAETRRMSSMVKRVIEATGHGLDDLLDQDATRAPSVRTPAPVWTTTSHALRPTSRCATATIHAYAFLLSGLVLKMRRRRTLIIAGVCSSCIADHTATCSFVSLSAAASTRPPSSPCTTRRVRPRIFACWESRTFWRATEDVRMWSRFLCTSSS